jgi:hypothetical protein
LNTHSYVAAASLIADAPQREGCGAVTVWLWRDYFSVAVS